MTEDASGPKHLLIKLTQAKLESLVDALVERTVAPCGTALRVADLQATSTTDVMLVGGQT